MEVWEGRTSVGVDTIPLHFPKVHFATIKYVKHSSEPLWFFHINPGNKDEAIGGGAWHPRLIPAHVRIDHTQCF